MGQWHYDRDTQTLYHAAAARGWHIEDRDADLLPPVLNDYETRLTNAAQALSAAREALRDVIPVAWMGVGASKREGFRVVQVRVERAVAFLAELDKATEAGG